MDWTKEDPDFLKDYKYYTDPTEIKARMMEMRFKEGLMPGDQFTMDMLKKYTEPSMFSRVRGSLFGDQSRNMFGMQGYLNLNTPGAQQNFLNIMNKYKKDGGSLPKAQGGGSPNYNFSLNTTNNPALINYMRVTDKIRKNPLIKYDKDGNMITSDDFLYFEDVKNKLPFNKMRQQKGG